MVLYSTVCTPVHAKTRSPSPLLFLLRSNTPENSNDGLLRPFPSSLYQKQSSMCLSNAATIRLRSSDGFDIDVGAQHVCFTRRNDMLTQCLQNAISLASLDSSKPPWTIILGPADRILSHYQRFAVSSTLKLQ